MMFRGSRTNSDANIPLPGFVLLLLLALLSLSHLYPQEAFGLRGVIAAAGLLVLTAICYPTAVASVRRSSVVLGAIALAWCAWWCLRGAPVPALGRGSITDILQGTLVFIVAWICVSRCGDERVVGPLKAPTVVAVWLSAAAVLLALHGLYQVWGPAGLPGTHARLAAELEQTSELEPGMRDAMLHLLREGRASGRFGSANIFAGLLAICVPMIIACGVAAKKIALRVLMAGAFVLVFAAIYASGSRGGLLAALFGAGLMAVLLMPWKRRVPAVAVMLMIGLMLAAPLTAQEGAQKSEFARRWLGGSTAQQRFNYWKSGVEIWSENWLAGRGAGAFQVYYFQHRVPGAQETGYAHSWFVQWGAETGILGVVLFISMCAVVFARGWLWRRRDRVMASGFLAAGAVALAGGLIEFTLSFREIYLDFSLILGVLAGSAAQGTEWKLNRYARAAFGLIPMFAGILLVHAQFRPAMADNLSEAALVAEDPREALELYDRALKWQPDDPRLYESRGFARLRMGDARAYDDFDRALKLNPHSARLHQSMAQYLSRVGRTGDAVEWQRRAVEVHRLDAMHRLVLAEMLWDAGEREEAVRLVEEAEKLIPNNEEILYAKRLREKFGMAVK